MTLSRPFSLGTQCTVPGAPRCLLLVLVQAQRVRERGEARAALALDDGGGADLLQLAQYGLAGLVQLQACGHLRGRRGGRRSEGGVGDRRRSGEIGRDRACGLKRKYGTCSTGKTSCNIWWTSSVRVAARC